jgi:hypothetical protein
MCNFNKHDEDTKALVHLLMKKCADALGGANFLLSLQEAMKEKRPNALMSKECEVKSKEATIKWNKIVFKDKLDVLEEIIVSHKSSEGIGFNILDEQNAKKKKKITNMVKTLAPIDFYVTPRDSQYGGFEFKVFEKTEDGFASLNPIFTAMFFCSVNYTKSALKYTI